MGEKFILKISAKKEKKNSLNKSIATNSIP